MSALASRPPTLALAGPTAAGKTALAMAFAAQGAAGRPVEIISVDSALVYRGMDIGTAKPSAEERTAVPHHLIDILEPHDAYSAARFCVEATALIDDIRSRGACPLLVGGTMLYFRALQQGLHAMPAADAAVRAAIDAEAAACGWPALHAELARVDPQTAARLAPGDAQRIQRALEVWRVSGRALSSWHAQAPMQGAGQGVQLHLVSLEPRDRGWLHARIAARFDAMLAHGLVAEVAALRQRKQLHADLPSMRCVGYRQVWQALDDAASRHDAALATSSLAPGSVAMAALREAGIAATRQLAKRQLTWLRSMPQRQVVDCDGEGVVDLGMHALQSGCART